MNEWEKLIIKSDITLIDAMRVIENGSVKMAFVVEDENYLKGILTDGDIRRALLAGYKLSDRIESIYTHDPVVVHAADSNDIIIRKSIQCNSQQLPLIDKEGRLVGLKELKDLLVTYSTHSKVVIMAGGLGTRLHPLTEKVPKPLLPVGGKPMLETIIHTFKEYGFTDFIISVNYKSDMIKSYFGDGEAFDVTIEYIDEDKRMGTAGSLTLMEEKLTAPFFVVNADLLTNINYNFMLQYHLAQGADATMGTRQYEMQVPYGVIHTRNQQILDIEEKPVSKYIVSGGIYILDPNVLSMIPKDSFYDMPTLLENLIQKKKKILSFSIRERDYWKDIGCISDYECANNDYEKYFN